MKKLFWAFVCLLIVGKFIFGQDLAKNTKAPETKPVATVALDFTKEEAEQLKNIQTVRAERAKEQEAAGKAIANAASDEDAVKSTLRYQLASERLTTLQLAEMLTVLNAKIRVNCLDCEYKGGTLVKPEPSAKK